MNICETSNTKRIAKNTVILYIRMLIVTLVGLYTSRVILQTLGVEDFGLYNVVGGVVSLFAFFRSSMERCTQRFLNVEMTKPYGDLQETFSTALVIHIFIALITLLFAETIGLWFLNTFIQIPFGRETAANIVYQTVIGGLLLTILTIPYSASIIAHERMGIFAKISIVDCIFNLFIAILISFATNDKLIFYAILLLFARFLNFSFYAIYCVKKFSEVELSVHFDKNRCKDMLGYTSWTLVGHAMILGTNHGNSILVNMFHGVSANAAMAIANQVNSHVLQLTGNFQTAFNPQITKAYASEDYSYLKKLIFSTSKISFFLLFVVTLPLILNIDYVLDLWLGMVPTDTNIFCVLMLASGILQATTAPLNFSIMATGRIKWFQIVTGLVFVSDLFILYALFCLGMPAYTAMYVKLGIMIGITIVRMYFCQKEIPCLQISEYIYKVILPLILTTSICVFISQLLISKEDDYVWRILMTFPIILLSIFVISFVGLTKSERLLVLSFIKRK